MPRITSPKTTLAILGLLAVGSLAGVLQASADEEEALPQLNDVVLNPPQAVVAADFYTRSASRICTAGVTCQAGTKVPDMSVSCLAGDEVVGSFAWRQDASQVAQADVLTKPIGANPVTGVLALVTFLPDQHRAFLRVICADTGS
jgi:hypothetical protein